LVLVLVLLLLLLQMQLLVGALDLHRAGWLVGRCRSIGSARRLNDTRNSRATRVGLQVERRCPPPRTHVALCFSSLAPHSPC
jgi:hypothetical protein